MTKKILISLLSIAATLILSACGGNKTLSNPDPRPMQTLPTIQTELTPAAQLTHAIGKSAGAGSFVLRYGTVFRDAESMTEQQLIRTDSAYTSLITAPDTQIFFAGNQRYTLSGESVQQETSPAPYSGSEIFAHVRSFLPNPNLIRDFTNQRLTVTPEADGALVYACGYLDEDELGQILYGGTLPQNLLPSGYSKIEGKISFFVDSNGRFTCLQVDIDLYQSGTKPDDTFTLLLTMEQIGTLESIPTPDWID